MILDQPNCFSGVQVCPMINLTKVMSIVYLTFGVFLELFLLLRVIPKCFIIDFHVTPHVVSKSDLEFNIRWMRM